MDRYAVVGNPIAHSKSPEIHSQFAEQTGQNLSYDKMRLEVNAFERDVAYFFSQGGKGLNVTVPFKEKAFQLADQLTDRARLAGAVNTLAVQHDGKILGDTTDGAGLVADLINHGWLLSGKRILLLGAGGAVRGVTQALLAQNPATLVIANRTVSKAQAIAKQFEAFGPVRASALSDLTEQSFDLIINGTSASLAGDLPQVPEGVINKQTSVYDMMYGAEFTPFLCWAQDQGAEQLADGLGMLVCQAAESFHLWRGIKPEVNAVVESLRLTLAASL